MFARKCKSLALIKKSTNVCDICKACLVHPPLNLSCAIVFLWPIIHHAPVSCQSPDFGACCGAKSVLSVPNIVHRWQSRRRLGAEFDKTKRSLRENEMLVELSYQADLARARPTSCYTSRLSLRNFFTLLTSIQTRKRTFLKCFTMEIVYFYFINFSYFT